MNSNFVRSAALLSAIAVATLVAPARAEDAATPAAGSAAGMKVYIDPETGNLTTPPPGQPSRASGAATSTADDLVVEENPAGGYTIDLQRRIRGVSRAKVGAAGVEVDCEGADAAEERSR